MRCFWFTWDINDEMMSTMSTRLILVLSEWHDITTCQSASLHIIKSLLRLITAGRNNGRHVKHVTHSRVWTSREVSHFLFLIALSFRCFGWFG